MFEDDECTRPTGTATVCAYGGSDTDETNDAADDNIYADACSAGGGASGGKGFVFGEVSFFTNARRSASVRAVDVCELLCLPQVTCPKPTGGVPHGAGRSLINQLVALILIAVWVIFLFLILSKSIHDAIFCPFLGNDRLLCAPACRPPIFGCSNAMARTRCPSLRYRVFVCEMNQ
jgi:hypothetical protein